jgi:SAM-dependent methyltransferase
MTTSMDNPAQYDDFASDYVSMEQLPSERVAANLFRNTVANFPSGLKVLDLACGTGTYARVLLKLGIAEQVVGVDLSSEMVRVGRQLQAEQRADAERIQFHVANCAIALEGQGFKLEPHSFDLVMGNWLFNYAADRTELMTMWQNVSTYLKAGGKFVGLMPIFEVQNHFDRDLWNGITVQEVCTVPGGFKVHITAHCSPKIEFDNFLLDRHLHEEAAAKGGMEKVSYCLPTKDDLPSLDQSEDATQWESYLRNPVSHICVAVKKS